MIFNSALYATQVILYVLIFVGGRESKQVIVVRNVVSVAMAGINLSSVFLVFLLYIYLSVTFSGFPYRSQSTRESLRKVTRLMAFWSISRIIWGVSQLIVYIHDVDLLRPTQAGWSPIVLFLLLVLCEIAPITVLMEYSFMTIFEFAETATREMTSLATGGHVLTSDEVDSQRDSQKTGRGGDEEVPALGGNRSLMESTEPLLGRNVS